MGGPRRLRFRGCAEQIHIQHGGLTLRCRTPRESVTAGNGRGVGPSFWKLQRMRASACNMRRRRPARLVGWPNWKGGIGSSGAAFHKDAQAPERPEPRGLPPAAEPRRQRTVNMADLRQDPYVDRHAGALLHTLSLVSDSDSEPDCVECDQRRRSTKRGRHLRSGMEARATDVVVNPQFWPHVALPLEQVGKSFAFAELDLRLLVAGELEIITADSESL